MLSFFNNKRRLGVIIALLVIGGLVAGSTFIYRSRHTEAGEFRNIFLPGGHRIEAVATGLTCPTGITWDAQRNMHVVLAGDPYLNPVGRQSSVGSGGGAPWGIDLAQAGTSQESGKVVRISRGKVEVIADGLNPPVSDAKFIDGDLYVAHRGTLSVFRNGQRQDLITGLPWGDYSTCEIAFKDGWIYLGNGTVTNSGLVGEDNFKIGWAKEHPDRCDVPAKDVTLSGENYSSPDYRRVSPPSTPGNPPSPAPSTVSTGGFVPFGTPTSPGQKITGNVLASGTILRVRPDGTGLEVYAWGFRNPAGIRFAPQGALIAIDQGFDDRGSRPIAGAPDSVYLIKGDSWYGWPDYAAGMPVTDARLKSPSKPSPAGFLMKKHPIVERPVATLEADTGAMKFDFASKGFDKKQRIFIAAFGAFDVLPGPTQGPGPSAGKIWWLSQGFDQHLAQKETIAHGQSILAQPMLGQSMLGQSPQMLSGWTAAGQTTPGQPPLGQVLALDPITGKVESFAYTRPDRRIMPGELRLNHPIDAKFGPDGCLYIVDYGVVEVSGGVPNAIPGTGVIWKISKQRSEYTEFVSETLVSLDEAKKKPWKPDYRPLQDKLRGFLQAQPEEWGLYFKDLVSGDTFGINENVEIPAASTVKVAVVLYASHLVSEGKLSWNEFLTYKAERDWRSGAGTLQFTAADGDAFSIRELAEKAIRDSDNVAWKMLERRLGLGNIINFMWSIGGKDVYPGGQNISTPKDNATYMEATLGFARESPEGQKLIFDLANTVWNTGLNRYIKEVTVAHKEGDVTGVSDDVGIVFSDFPYILSIMSQGHEDVEDGFEKIGEISRMVFDYQQGLPRP